MQRQGWLGKIALGALVWGNVWAAAAQSFDVVVYGATPAGIAAAVTAARDGKRVLLAEPTTHIGGLLTGGLSYSDFRTQESVTGFFREYMTRVLRHYEQQYGKNSQQVQDCFEGALAEPKVSAQILDAMLTESKRLHVWKEARLRETEGERQQGKVTLKRASFLKSGKAQRVRARFWIDATYEGDLAAAAKVPYRLGRESRSVYGEKYAGVLYFDQGKILAGSTGEGDRSEQCANYRVILTEDPDLRLAVPKPEGYRREEFAHLIPLFRSGRIREVYTEDRSGILRLQRIANGKADMNDIKQAPVRLALPGENQGWSEGGVAERERIARRHERYAKGLIYFLQNDEDVPGEIRDKARVWGLAKDEFVGNGHWPTALYVREGRRIEGEYTFREQDTQAAPGKVRVPLQADSVAIGDYVLNNHGHHPPGPLHPGLVEGDFSAPTMPFQVPYGVMEPKGYGNLLVPVALSASHVGYSALRLEATWTALGHAAGLAASASLTHGRVDIRALQRRLHKQGQATIYTSDVGPQHKGFRTVQWAGQKGLLADLDRNPEAASEPLRKRYGLQYSFAFPGHAVGYEERLDPELEAAWKKRLPCASGVQASQRGEFLEKARAACAP